MTTHEYLLQKYGTTLTFQQASEETGIFWQTIREMCLRGDIKTVRAGRRWILTTKALAEFLDNGKIKKEELGPVKMTGYGHKKIV
jgi:hypothetical protein